MDFFISISFLFHSLAHCIVDQFSLFNQFFGLERRVESLSVPTSNQYGRIIAVLPIVHLWVFCGFAIRDALHMIEIATTRKSFWKQWCLMRTIPSHPPQIPTNNEYRATTKPYHNSEPHCWDPNPIDAKTRKHVLQRCEQRLSDVFSHHTSQ